MIVPRLQTILLCESVGRGPGTRKTLFGLMDRLVFPVFPGVLKSCSVFGRFGYGEGEFEARFVLRGNGERVIYSAAEGCRFVLEDPLDVADIVLELENLTFDEPGSYWVDAWLGDIKLPESLALYVDPARQKA